MGLLGRGGGKEVEVARAVARLVADTRDFDRKMTDAQKETRQAASGIDKELTKASGSAKKHYSVMGGLMRKGALLGASALTVFAVGAKQSIDAASNLGEQVNKTTVVFGKSAPMIQNWAKTTAGALGISNRAALEAAGVYGNMLKPLGIAEGKAAVMSKRMVTLAADMASFNNASPEDVLDALRSGLSGESEPLRKFGVFLSDARMKQEALNLGIYKGKGALTAAQKAQATYSLILKDTKDAQGDFANTSKSAANAQRIQAAQVEDLKAKLGTGLLPAYQALLQVGLKVIGFFADHTELTKKVVLGVVAVSGVLVAMAGFIKTVAIVTETWATAQKILNAVMKANPIILVITLLVALGVALVIAYKKSETFRNIVHAALDAVLGIAKRVGAFFTTDIPAAWDRMRGAASTAFGAVKRIASRAWDAIKRGWEILKTVLSYSPLGLIIRHFGTIRRAGRKAFDALVSPIKTVIRWLKRVVTWADRAIDKIKDVKPKIPGVGKNDSRFGLPDVSWLSRGGIVPQLPGTQRGRDGVAAMLAPREMVLTESHQQNLLRMLSGGARPLASSRGSAAPQVVHHHQHLTIEYKPTWPVKPPLASEFADVAFAARGVRM